MVSSISNQGSDGTPLKGAQVILEIFSSKLPTCPGDAPPPARAAESIARAVSVALLPHLHNLKEEGLTPLAVRVTLDQDNVSPFQWSSLTSTPTCLPGAI